MTDTSRNTSIQKKQRRALALLLGILSVLLLGLSLWIKSPSPIPTEPGKDTTVTQPLATPLEHVNAQSIWIERAQHQLAQEKKASEGLQQQLHVLEQAKTAQDKTVEQHDQTLRDLQMQMAALQKQVSDTQNASGLTSADTTINEATLTLTPATSLAKPTPRKNPQTFVPAGSFVRAIALGGADASAGVTSQANPTPMVFRLLDNGTLPNHRQSRLKDCVATAAAIGDISSERGAVRLERLSCTEDSGNVIEMPVEATVFGPDGKEGIRGIPVWREGALLQRAFAAGTLSGLSTGIAQNYTTSSLTPWGGKSDTVDNRKILHYGVANGISNAADTLAEYNIKRAEQYHPVIQLSAGTVVDIVFLKGFYLDERKEEATDYLALTPAATQAPPVDKMMPAFNVTEQPTTLSTNTRSPLPLTPQQIHALQQKAGQQGYF